MMNPFENKIYIKNRNSVLGKQLERFLQANGFVVVDFSEVKRDQTIPWIVYQGDSTSAYLKQYTQENTMNPHTAPKTIFHIQLSNDLQQEHVDVHVEKVINIQLKSAAGTPQPVSHSISTMHPFDLKALIQSIGEIVTKHLDNPLDKGIYIEHIPLQNTHTQTIGVVGLGYVGLPIAVACAKMYNVIGFDTNEQKIQLLTDHTDPTGETSTETLQDASIHFTSTQSDITHCDYIIVAVPTPITKNKIPDLASLVEASTTIGKYLSPGTVIIYESTVYPGTTDDICIPILETYSSLTAGKDFLVGYSPERINPGDKEHTFERNNKVVSGQNEHALKKVTKLYESVIEGNIHQAPSMAVAEASKIVENAQRDINIAFMNELSIIFNTLDLDTNEVLKASETKWNFLPFTPGLVGGHCIGVDPYYLIYKSQRAGYHPTFLASAREINDFIPQYIVQQFLYIIAKHAYNLKDFRITVLGVTFKENIPDLRNSKALEIVQQLENLQMNVQLCDPHVEAQELRKYTDFPLKTYDKLEKTDAIIIPVPHDAFSSKYDKLSSHLFTDNKGIIMDIKGILSPADIPNSIIYWNL